MKKILTNPETYFIGYILMILITFGNAYHRVPDEEKMYIGGEAYTVHNGIGTKAFGAFMSSVAWPMYWSVQIWR